MPDDTPKAQRLPAEVYFAEELHALREADPWPRPPGWRLSPRGVEAFVLGDGKLSSPKFVAPGEVVTRIIIALATSRGRDARPPRRRSALFGAGGLRAA